MRGYPKEPSSFWDPSAAALCTFEILSLAFLKNIDLPSEHILYRSQTLLVDPHLGQQRRVAVGHRGDRLH